MTEFPNSPRSDAPVDDDLNANAPIADAAAAESADAVNERVSRLASATTPPASERRDAFAFDELPGAHDPASDDTVREYERRYKRKYGIDESPYIGEKAKRGGIPRFWEFRDEAPRSYNAAGVTEDEKLWASIAHASVWFTILAGVITAGIVPFVSIFVPLVIYFMFRRRSEYVAFHAMQAFVLQAVATVGVVILAFVGVFAWLAGLLVALLSMIVLVGFILVPVWAIIGVVFFIAIAALPVVALVIGTIAAIETYKGRDYRYPWIARWVDRQLAGAYLHTA